MAYKNTGEFNVKYPTRRRMANILKRILRNDIVQNNGTLVESIRINAKVTGFGPYAVLPTYLILRKRPELEEAFKPFFPAGMPQTATDLFAPAAFRRLRSMWTQDELYVRTFNQMLVM